MGAGQSSNSGSGAAPAPRSTTDYYELLAVDQSATDDVIKKAYRQKALELHPDRNFGDVENATAKFADVQAAYDVLSDPQERAWYDSHRDAILAGHDDAADVDTFRNVPLTTTDHIFSLMSRFSKQIPFDDSPSSFFTILRDTFDRLADAEYAAADAISDYPTFGESTDGDHVAKAFYTRWANFSTRLTFSWRDKWRLSDAPDRRIRRLMEKENKKLRDDAVREFNDAVRSLVIFARKRDPRYIPNTQSEAERQKILRDSAAAQAARSRAANLDKMKSSADALPEWARSREDDSHLGEFSQSDDASEVEEIECVVCNKTFKSENQYEAHEKSKKHLKAVQQLRRQMKQEDAELDLAENANLFEARREEWNTEEPKAADTEEEDVASTNSWGEKALQGGSEAPSWGNASEDEDYASRDAVEARLTGIEVPIDETAAGVADLSLGSEKPPQKMGKAKAKKAKKAAQQIAAEQQGQPCLGCRALFDSKSKLFEHLGYFPEHMATKGPAKTKKAGKKKH